MSYQNGDSSLIVYKKRKKLNGCDPSHKMDPHLVSVWPAWRHLIDLTPEFGGQIGGCYQWIGLREKIQETPVFHGKIHVDVPTNPYMLEKTDTAPMRKLLERSCGSCFKLKAF